MDKDPPIFNDDAFARILGVRTSNERVFVEGLVKLLGTLDRGLLPPPAPHPLSAFIAKGTAGVEPLLQMLESGDDKKKREALDALAHVLLQAPHQGAVLKLRAFLGSSKDIELAALVEKTLAIARDEATLRPQLKRLGDDDPAVVASAARLLGFGRYTPAVPALMALVSPERLYESRWVLWALGEMGDPAALPALDVALAHAFRVVDCLIALGKIGHVTSIPHVTPHLVGVIPEQKDAAARALAMILDKNREDTAAITPLKAQLGGLLERELADATAPLSASTRYHMLLCLARLGHKLDEARVKKYLGGSFAPASAKNVAALRIKAKATVTRPATRPRSK